MSVQPLAALAHGVPLAAVYLSLKLVPELTLTTDELALILMTAAVLTTNVRSPLSSLLKTLDALTVPWLCSGY